MTGLRVQEVKGWGDPIQFWGLSAPSISGSASLGWPPSQATPALLVSLSRSWGAEEHLSPDQVPSSHPELSLISLLESQSHP